MQHGCCLEQGPASLLPSTSHPCLLGQDEDCGVLSAEGHGHPAWDTVLPVNHGWAQEGALRHTGLM